MTMALRIAWYKVHRPAAYYCAYYRSGGLLRREDPRRNAGSHPRPL
ncbi:MAG: hypothetical protein ACLUI3_03125 [Christensenellales bacterium]